MTDLIIHYEVEVSAPVAEVWRLWTTTEGITAWFVKQAKVELRPGGPFELYFAVDAPQGERGSETCQIIAWLPQKMLIISWNAPPQIPSVRHHEHKAWVVIEFDSADLNRTKVSITHYGFLEGPDWTETHAYFQKAWKSVLQALAQYIDKQKS